MNSVFQDDNKIDHMQQSTRGVIDHTTTDVYVCNPLDYASSFERAPVLIPTVGATMVTPPTKKRKSVSTQKEFKTLQKRLRIDTVLELCDIYCYENSEETFEDLDMEKQLGEMTVLPVQKTVWVNGSEFQNIQGSQVDPVSVDMYSSFQHWGTDKSPFAHSISQLY